MTRDNADGTDAGAATLAPVSAALVRLAAEAMRFHDVLARPVPPAQPGYAPAAESGSGGDHAA
ncbi:hypothetical protein MTBLM5_450005 [Magnetospirillum sp. LM-5]|uniref:hypothetical protein n=1 Tax=Magnetospirillum sp. LM-5 TaxID=2681466 RepID=UPI00137DCE21|nr:hypothetical protein [Magnetospirillum sp. LM-5]CAA7622176.1 hypothetical protein MTBLM5_450005 [Magnetospirillum sp. LM-5]